jgi:hypothetical protein
MKNVHTVDLVSSTMTRSVSEIAAKTVDHQRISVITPAFQSILMMKTLPPEMPVNGNRKKTTAAEK